MRFSSRFALATLACLALSLSPGMYVPAGEAPVVDGAYVGLDLGMEANITPTPEILTPGPSVRLGAGVTTLRAVAVLRGRFDSAVAQALYWVGLDARLDTVSICHIGNSLTDTFVNGGLQEVTLAEDDPKVTKFTIPGCPDPQIQRRKKS